LDIQIDKLKLKGHGSFYLREGWLRKGLKEIINNPAAFSSDDIIDKLGVGANMVNAIKYYLEATGLIESYKGVKGRKEYSLTENCGVLLKKYDEYFEDIFSIWILHYNICTKPDFATTWYLFFNGIYSDEIKREDIKKQLRKIVEYNFPESSYSVKSLDDDIYCLIRSYDVSSRKLKGKNPEDNLICPFSELDLISEEKNLAGEKVVLRRMPDFNKLDPMMVLYVLVDTMKSDSEESKPSISIDDVLNENGNLGKLFNLDRAILSLYLDELIERKYISVNRNVLDMIYLEKPISKIEIIKNYFGDEGNNA